MPRILFVSGFHPSTRARDLAYEFERYGRLLGMEEVLIFPIVADLDPWFDATSLPPATPTQVPTREYASEFLPPISFAVDWCRRVSLRVDTSRRILLANFFGVDTLLAAMISPNQNAQRTLEHLAVTPLSNSVSNVMQRMRITICLCFFGDLPCFSSLTYLFQAWEIL